MDTKLTLKLDESIIEKAKLYSKTKHISLSRLVEKFFSTLDVQSANKKESEDKISSLVKEISGIFDDEYEYDIKKQKEIRLIKKYL